jgi:hypothetical protein
MRAPALILIALAACSPDPWRASNADAVSWLAVLEADDRGRLASRAPLERWDGGAIELRAEADAIVVGFSGAQLAPYAVENDQLVESSGCAPKLPPPIWAASWIEDEVVEIAPESVPRLTAAFVERDCPAPESFAVFIDPSCADQFCKSTLTPQTACLGTLDLGCGLGAATASIDRAGDVCLDFAGSGWDCQEIAPVPGARATYQCSAPQTCTFSAYSAARSDPPFTLETHALFDAPDWIHPILARRDYLGPRMLRAGYAFDLVLLEDRAVVTAGEGPAEESCPSGGQHARRLHFVDLSTFAPIRTATAPPCLDELGPDPIGDGFIGAFDANGVWHVGRFDREGRLLQATPASPSRGDYKAFGLESPDPNTIAALFTVAEPLVPGPTKSVLLIYDAVTLALRDTYEYPVGARIAMTTPEDGIVALASWDPRMVHGLSVDRGFDAWTTVIEGDFPFWHAFFDAIPGDDEGDVLISGSFPAALYAIRGRGTEVVRSDVYPLDSVPLTAARWSGDLFLVSLIEIGTDASWLAFYDAAQPSFQPSVWKIGNGPVRRIEIDPSGRAWFLLPWSAKLVRLTQR